MNRRLLALALCLGCVSLAIVATSAALLMETEGATVERTRWVSEVSWWPVAYPIVVTPTRTPKTPTPVPDATWTPEPTRTPTYRTNQRAEIDMPSPFSPYSRIGGVP